MKTDVDLINYIVEEMLNADDVMLSVFKRVISEREKAKASEEAMEAYTEALERLRKQTLDAVTKQLMEIYIRSRFGDSKHAGSPQSLKDIEEQAVLSGNAKTATKAPNGWVAGKSKKITKDM